MGPIGSPETSVLNYLTRRHNPEDGRIQFSNGGSIRYRKSLSCKKALDGTRVHGKLKASLDDAEMDLKERMEGHVLNSSGLGQGEVTGCVNTHMNFRIS